MKITKRLTKILESRGSSIIETRAWVGCSMEYTGNYRLIGIGMPADLEDYVDLPGRGGRATLQAAEKFLEAFSRGLTYGESARIAWTM